MNPTQVLIVGAGPTGLVLALWLTRLGVAVRIVDRTATPGTTSRALAVQARTLELYRQLDLSDAVVQGGHAVPAANLWVRGDKAARIPLASTGGALTPFPFLLIYPQDQHEQLLVERLQAAGVQVERQTELLDFTQDEHHIQARLRLPDGSEQTLAADYLAGCDGARSTVRKGLGIEFPGGTYEQVFYVADVDAEGPALDGELHVDIDEADFLAVFPLAGNGRARLIGTVRVDPAQEVPELGFEDVSGRAIELMKVRVKQVNWFSAYRVHHRVAQRFRRRRAFLLGDAAHVHSPAGGQGMNTGIGDAINLAWKLASLLQGKAGDSLLQGKAGDSLLDSYEIERMAFAERLVATTDQVFSFITADGRLARLLRTRLAPVLLPRVAALAKARGFLFRTVSQIGLNYRLMPLSFGNAGEVQGGDRLPWVSDNGRDNYAGLARPCWQVQVYGNASEALVAWCAGHALPLEVFPWTPACQAAGLAHNGIYLLRPDSYVALAQHSSDVAALERYFGSRGLKP